MITVETLRVCRLRNVGHYKGSGYFGDLYQCIEHPRLKRAVTYYKKIRTSEVRFLVDGKPVDNLEAAAAALNVPPAPSPRLVDVLMEIGTEFGDYRRLTKFDDLSALGDMGLIEWGERGHCRLSESGRLTLLRREGVLL